MTAQAFPSKIAKAYNDLIIEKSLPLDKRFSGSMMVAAQNPEETGKKIKKLGDNDRIQQVLLSNITSMEIVQKLIHAIFKAVHECNKSIAFRLVGTSPQEPHPYQHW